MNPLVTIYVVSKDYGKYLSIALDSVIHQTYPNYELIIVNDGSSDDTAAICRDFVSANKQLSIKYIENERSIGLQKVANKVLATCNGKYLIRLDADDWLDENALLILTNLLETNNQYDIAFGNYTYVNEEGLALTQESRVPITRGRTVNMYPPHGACTMVRTIKLKLNNGYDESVSAQDGWELFLKLGGNKVTVNTSANIFYYRQHHSSLSHNKKRMFSERNKIISKLSSPTSGSYSMNNVILIPLKDYGKQNYNVLVKNEFGVRKLEHLLNEVSLLQHKYKIFIYANEEIVDLTRAIAKNINVNCRYLIRKKFYPIQYLPLSEILRDFLIDYNATYKDEPKIDLVTYLNIHGSDINTERIEAAVNTCKVTQADTVFTVNKNRMPIFRLENSGLSLINRGRFDDLEYEKDTTYVFDGDIICTWASHVMQSDIFSGAIGYVEK